MINPSRKDLVATDGINQIEDKAMSDWEWFEKNIGHDNLMREMRKEEGKRSRKEEKEA